MKLHELKKSDFSYDGRYSFGDISISCCPWSAKSYVIKGFRVVSETNNFSGDHVYRHFSSLKQAKAFIRDCFSDTPKMSRYDQ